MPGRQQKITLGEMRSSGVRGLLIYCAESRSAQTDGRMTFGYPIWKRVSHANRVARKAPMSGRCSR
jgi:hypothetical protein